MQLLRKLSKLVQFSYGSYVLSVYKQRAAAAQHVFVATESAKRIDRKHFSPTLPSLTTTSFWLSDNPRSPMVLLTHTTIAKPYTQAAS